MLELEPDGEMIAEMPYAELQCMLDDPPGFRNYWSAEYLDALPDEAIDAFCARADDMIVPSPSQHALFPQGGAVAREPPTGRCPWRHAPWVRASVRPLGRPGRRRPRQQWARDVRAAVTPWATGAMYLNFIGDEGAGSRRAGLRRRELPRAWPR